MKAYKIVELVDGNIKTLFHGVNGSRVMPKGEWIKAEYKQVTDGSGQKPYLSGWHVLLNYEDCVTYMSRFKTRLDLLNIIECDVKNARRKEHSPSPVYLAEYIKF